MDLLERAIFFSIGGAVGFILGYIAAQLREIKEEVDEIDHIVKNDRPQSEGGFMRVPLMADMLYLLVLLIVIWGVIQAQRASNEVEESQKKIAELAICNNEYLTAQGEFLSIYLEDPPPTRPERRFALEHYLELLEAYSRSNSNAIEESPYTNREILRKCVESTAQEELLHDE